MNWDNIQGIIRTVGPMLLGYAAASGWIGQGDIPNIITAICTLGACVWSVVHKAQLKGQI